MCGRYTLETSKSQLALLFGELNIQPDAEFVPRYNIAPSQHVLAVRVSPGSGQRELVPLKWGLLPRWAKDPAMAHRMINARAETVHEKPAFRAAARYRRCLIPASGFYEWQRIGKTKQPYVIRVNQDAHLFAMAGLWEQWMSPDGSTVETCTILTVEADPTIAQIHDRMPLVLPPEVFGAWLDPQENSTRFVPKLLEQLGYSEQPASPHHPWYPIAVSTWVNSPAHDDPQCIAPV